jgi:hypothetical protein
MMNVRGMDRLQNVALPYDPVVLTASKTIDSTMSGRVIVLKAAAGLTATLPKALGQGLKFFFYVQTLITSNTYIISRAIAADLFQGIAFVSFGTTNVNGFIPGATDNTFTMNGTTCGGYAGDYIAFTDIAKNLWSVQCNLQATTSAATPYSTV